MNTHVTRLAAPGEISAQRTVTRHLTLLTLNLIGAVVGHIGSLFSCCAPHRRAFCIEQIAHSGILLLAPCDHLPGERLCGGARASSDKQAWNLLGFCTR
ncbi:hypothetical protein UB43_26445 [Pseudomonas sp. 21]|uniref:hypothetical protein n=1 Tax=unclassified Pseudomonas TaxID=196821 RepID=UPI0005EB4934|nr:MULTISPECIES: hypothetical protein [unclassified Pseudomonas]KJJ95854.1 hypothetical protein UB43_26445 [Pseudomonas sp. 21]MBV7586303.1 hypothetical protein [Pseudomonas sp. PDM33]